MSQKHCRPHEWLTPTPGDSHLKCAVCGRLLALHELHPQHVRYGVLRAYARRCGLPAAKEFASALADALNEAQNRRHAHSAAQDEPF